MKTHPSVELFKKVTALIVCTIFFLQLTSCGTILYPERRGQKPELARLDVGVVILDGALLFFFVLPGVIAYAVDFSTGCIYLPSGQIILETNDDNDPDIQVIHIDPDKLDLETIERVVQEHTGQPISIDSPDLLVFNPDTQHLDVHQELIRLNMGLSRTLEETWFTGAQAKFLCGSVGRVVKIEVAEPMNTCPVVR